MDMLGKKPVLAYCCKLELTSGNVMETETYQILDLMHPMKHDFGGMTNCKRKI